MMRFPDNYLCFTKWLDDAIANPRRINRRAESLYQYRYTFMLRQFAEVFDDRIITLEYEELVDNPMGFSRKLARLLGADADEIESLFALPPKNPTRNELFYLYRRLGKKLCSVPLLDLSNLSIAKKLNAAVERWTAKLPKKRSACPSVTALA
jgi:hypothetical protein